MVKIAEWPGRKTSSPKTPQTLSEAQATFISTALELFYLTPPWDPLGGMTSGPTFGSTDFFSFKSGIYRGMRHVIVRRKKHWIMRKKMANPENFKKKSSGLTKQTHSPRKGPWVNHCYFLLILTRKATIRKSEPGDSSRGLAVSASWRSPTTFERVT